VSQTLDRSLRSFGASPQVATTISIIRALVGVGSGVANIVAGLTGDRGVILAVRWLDFFLGARPLPPEMEPEALQKLADACVDTEWMQDRNSALAMQVIQSTTNLLYLIPGAGGAVKKATDVMFAIWSFAQAFRNRICATSEIRAIIASRADLTEQIVIAMPSALRRDWGTALRRRIAVETALEQAQLFPPVTASAQAQLDAIRADDVPSAQHLLAVEKLVLRFHPAGAPAFEDAPATTVARRYIKRPPGYVPPPPPPPFRPLPVRHTQDTPEPAAPRSTLATTLYVLAGAGFLVFLLRRRRARGLTR